MTIAQLIKKLKELDQTLIVGRYVSPSRDNPPLVEKVTKVSVKTKDVRDSKDWNKDVKVTYVEIT